MKSEGLVNGLALKMKGDAYLALEMVCKEEIIPKLLVTYMEKEEMYGKWGRIIKRNLIEKRNMEPGSGFQNWIEGEIKKIKKH